MEQRLEIYRMGQRSRYRMGLVFAAALLATFVPGSASCAAGDPGVAFSDWGEPFVVRSMDGFHGSVRAESDEPIGSAFVAYRYSTGLAGEVTAFVETEDVGLIRFEVPADADAGLGELRYSVRVTFADSTGRGVESKTRTLAVAHAEELDITGEAAVALLYPLMGDAYMVRYVPCCNIYGGITYGVRSRVNPEGIGAGLPSKLVSDFVVLEPDGLSASTMGLYFVFTYDADKVGEAGPVLYEFNGRDAWDEVVDYKVDADAHTVLIHTPDGGTYVLGAN